MILTILVFLFYLFWGILSLLSQGESALNRKIKSRDLLDIIPNYRFFCPEPARYDYHLYYRVIINNEIRWIEVLLPKRNRAICFIWHPEKKDRKVFTKIIKTIRKQRKNTRLTNKPIYKMLLEYIYRYAALEANQMLQFKITRQVDLDADKDETIIYTSQIHTITNFL